MNESINRTAVSTTEIDATEINPTEMNATEISSPPSPEDSELRAFFADQTLTEFLGEGSQLIFGWHSRLRLAVKRFETTLIKLHTEDQSHD